jgi:hypothetical protein
MADSSKAETETRFSKLDPETRAFAMVGQFMQAFALMESALHNAISAALTMDKRKIQILGANIETGKKVKILRTLIDISDTYLVGEKAKIISSLGHITTYLGTRNVVAHCLFEASQDGKGVTFHRVQASGQFSDEPDTWDEVRLLKEIQTLRDHKSMLDEIGARFRNKPVDARQIALYWKRGQSDDPIYDMSTMQRGVAPVLQNSLRERSSPPQTHHDDTTSQEREPETPAEPQG